MCLTEPGWVLEPGLCLRGRCWEMPQEQRYNQGIGISDFRKSWWFGRSNCELSLSDLIFSALDPLYFLKARLCIGVLSQLPEITRQETLPGREETHRLTIQTLVCHTDNIAYSNFPQGRGKRTLLVLLSPPSEGIPVHSRSPWTARFQPPCQSRELPTQMCYPSSSFSLLSPLSVNPPRYLLHSRVSDLQKHSSALLLSASQCSIFCKAEVTDGCFAFSILFWLN